MYTEELTPREIVAELDKFIIGQEEAKKSVAVAVRNRFRRKMLPESLQDEVMPKNIIMIGPTGVGKTEIARRLSRLVSAPFVKVEATKFTEVGYVGRDVESIIRDLVETSIRMVQTERMKEVEDKAYRQAEERIIEIMAPYPKKETDKNNPLNMLFAITGSKEEEEEKEEDDRENDYRQRVEQVKKERELIRKRLKKGLIEEEIIEIEVEDKKPPMLEVFSGQNMEEMGINMQDLFGNMLPRKKKKKKVTVQEARNILQQEEAQKMIDMDSAINEAISKAEQLGIVFLDELDKVAGSEGNQGADVSREGVQRDILPIVEGSTVITKYGPVKTDHILFIASGAFHTSKPSDLIPELQGRFPIRVELQSLNKEDFIRILSETDNALIKQYTALLETEGINLSFAEGTLEKIAEIACELNQDMENIGARRLHTILEKIFEDISFEATDYAQKDVIIDEEYVQNKLKNIVKNKDLSKYIL